MIMRAIDERVLNQLIIDASNNSNQLMVVDIDKILDTRELTDQQKLYKIINHVNNIEGYTVTNSIPSPLMRLETRLNIQLAEMGNNIIDKAIKGVKVQLNKLDEPLQELYKEHFSNVYRFGFDTISKQPEIRFENLVIPESRLNRIVDERTFRASETTMNNLKGEVLPKIKEGIKEGKSYSKTGESLKLEFRDMTNNQLQRISRTETHSIYNQSKLEAMQQSNVVTGKEWLSSGLPNMREWHAEADGQSVSVDEPFNVMDEDLMYPGDPNGSEENIINCACTMKPDIRYGRE